MAEANIGNKVEEFDTSNCKQNTEKSHPNLFETVYAKHIKFSDQVKIEYLQLHKQLVEKLNKEQIAPFVKSLERENFTIENQEELIEAFKQCLQQELQLELEQSWENHDIANKFALLGIMKERCKKFEGTKWNIPKKDVEQRTLPVRMQFKEMQVRMLQTQLHHQKLQLQEILNENILNRKRIHDISRNRIFLKESLENSSIAIKTFAPKLLKLSQALLDSEIEELEATGNIKEQNFYSQSEKENGKTNMEKLDSELK